MDKVYLDSQQLLEDSFRLAADVYQSGFQPTFIIAIWRGGAPIGIAVQEFLSYVGIETDHIAIRTSSYEAIDNRSHNVAVKGLGYLIKNLTADDRLLIVDDVFDTGRTIEAVIEDLRGKLRRNMPEDVRIAVPYYKPKRSLTTIVPDYFLYETEDWLKYPHSLEGLTLEEVAEHRPAIYNVIGDLLEARQA